MGCWNTLSGDIPNGPSGKANNNLFANSILLSEDGHLFVFRINSNSVKTGSKEGSLSARVAIVSEAFSITRSSSCEILFDLSLFLDINI